jgi:FdhD protein
MIKVCGSFGVKQVDITRVNGADANRGPDDISVEEPLQISVGWDDGHGLEAKTIAITMRTPGEDKHLAVGFLFTETIIASASDVESVKVNGTNAVTVILNRGVRLDSSLLERHSFISSSCGACGKRSRGTFL